jgi:hypothetical protein
MELSKPRIVPGFFVVRMKPLRQEPIHPVNRVELGVRVYLQHFVAIQRFAIGHYVSYRLMGPRAARVGLWRP